ncbi:MAG: elongation factor G [Candidatus Binatia bacterium]|nr:elongation factor G [Candidatus Binatia bacterium]
MAALDPARIRNLVLIGHGGVGKTTLGEALLLTAGQTNSRGVTADRTSNFDTEPEEEARGHSMFSAFHHLTWKDQAINIVDCPGANAFVHDASAVLQGATTAVLVVSSHGETRGEDEKVLSWVADGSVPRIAFVTGMDHERADFERAREALTVGLELKPVALHLPIGAGDGFVGIVDVLHQKALLGQGEKGQSKQAPIPDDLVEAAESAREQLVEAVAEADDDLLEKYLEEGELGQEELRAGLVSGIASGALLPLLCGSGEKAFGVGTFLDFIAEDCPSAADLPPALGDDPKTGDEILRAADLNEPFSAQIIRTLIDPFAGKLSVMRVFSGKVAADSPIFNSTRAEKEKLGHLFRLEGKKQVAVTEAVAGDLVAVAKLKVGNTGDTLCDEKVHTYYPLLRSFEPAISFALEAKNKGEEDKVMVGLQRLQEEDPAIHLDRDPESKEIMLGAMGQLHVDLVVERLKRKFGAEVLLSAPKIPYRETVRSRSQAEGRLKKQTGGHGQFALAQLEIEPLPRGAGFEFVDKVVGGSVPRNFIPAVEKGVIETMRKGALGGYPVVDVRVTLYDGKHHDVDSSEMAFKLAAAMGFKAAFEKAKPVILEPIMAIDVSVPDEAMGDVLGDVNSRRGKVQGVEPKGHGQVIKAMIPMAEILTYAPDLNSMTGGRGSFHVEFSHYEELPSHFAEKIAWAKKQSEGS